MNFVHTWLRNTRKPTICAHFEYFFLKCYLRRDFWDQKTLGDIEKQWIQSTFFNFRASVRGKTETEILSSKSTRGFDNQSNQIENGAESVSLNPSPTRKVTSNFNWQSYHMDNLIFVCLIIRKWGIQLKNCKSISV